MKLKSLALAASIAIGTNPAAAQENTEEPAAEPAPVVRETTAPYDEKLLRLSEVLGSVHYLRTLCRSGEGTRWRDTMSAIIEAERPTPNRKARLIARFNRGYRAFNQVYNTCTESAVLAGERYTKEGQTLSTQITTRYGR